MDCLSMTFRRVFPVIALLSLVTGCAETDQNDRNLEPYQEDAGADADAGFDGGADDSGDVGGGDVGNDASENNTDNDTAENQNTQNDETGCQPVGDGVVRRAQFPLEVGQSAPYAFGLDVSVDTAGGEVDGTRTWDFSEIRDGEFVDDVDIEDPDAYWFGEEFPEATYTAPMTADDEDDEMGIFELTDEALLMLGVATPDDGFYRTELEYEPPVTLLEFPIEEGKTWQTEAEVSGSYGGNHAHSHEETYTTEVDAAGSVITPYGTFDALRVNTQLERGYWGAFGWTTETLRSHTFVAECFGTVTRIRSHENEDDEEFGEAAELMRLAQ